RAVGDRPIGGHHPHAHLVVGIHTPGEHPSPGVLRLPDHRVRRLGHGGPFLLGDEVHRAVIERDQIPRHLTTPFSAVCFPPLTLLRTRAQQRLTNHRELIGLGENSAHFSGVILEHWRSPASCGRLQSCSYPRLLSSDRTPAQPAVIPPEP